MSASPDIRQQISTLSIPKHQRPRGNTPTGQRRGRFGSFFAALVFFGLGIGALVAWQRYGGQIKGLPGITAAPAATEVKLLPVTLQCPPDPAAVLTATGKIVSDHLVEVVTKVSGQIVALHFEQGDVVEKGQMLARIEDVNYRARRDEAAAMLEKSRANLTYQHINFERVRQLREREQSSDIELADARRWHDDAVAHVAADEAALQYAEKALRDTEVIAPIAGVVLERNVEVGDFVAAEGGRGANANAQFAAIADMSKLRVEVDINELDIGRIRKDTPCIITPDAYKDRRYTGRVMWLDPGANYAKATVQAKVRIDHPDAYLRVEGAAQVTFLSEAPKNAAEVENDSAIWIPLAACALDTSGARGRVFVADGSKLRQTTVQFGRKNGAQIEVTSGLSAGQQIAASGIETLKDGQSIKP